MPTAEQNARLAQAAESTLTAADDLYGLGGNILYPIPKVLNDLEERAQDGTERLQFSIPVEGTPIDSSSPFPGRCVWVRDGGDVRSYRVVRRRDEFSQAGRVYRMDCAGARYDLDTAGPKIENRLVNWEKRATLEEWLEILLEGMPSGWTYDTTGLPDDQFRMATGGMSRLAVLENLATLAGRELEVTETSSALTVSMPEFRGSRDAFRITDVEAIRNISYEFDQRDEITHLIPQGNGRLMDRTQLDVVAVQNSGRDIFLADDISTGPGSGQAWSEHYIGTMSDGSDAVTMGTVDNNPTFLVSGSKTRLQLSVDTSFSASDKMILFQPDGTTFVFEVPGRKDPRVTESYDVDDSGGNNLLENPLFNGTVTSNVPEGWTRIGTPTITRNTQEWNYGGAAVKVVASAGGQGVEQTRSDEEGGSAFNMGAVAWLFITSGKVRVQAIQTSGTTDTRFPADDKTGQGVAEETDRWIRVSVPGQPGFVGGGIRITSYDGAATFILDAASPFIGSPPPHPEVGRFSHRLLLKACARMRQIQSANEPSINGAIIDYKRLAGDPPLNPGDDVEVWIRRTLDSRYRQLARVSSVRTRPTVRGDTQLVLEHKVRAMDALLRPRQVPAGTGVPLLPNAVAIPQDEEGNAGGLTADQEALLDIVDNAFAGEGEIASHVVRQDQTTLLGFMSGFLSGTGQDGATFALPIIGTAVPYIEVQAANSLVHPGGAAQAMESNPEVATAYLSQQSPHRAEVELLRTPEGGRVRIEGYINIGGDADRFYYRPYRIADGTTTRVYDTSSDVETTSAGSSRTISQNFLGGGNVTVFQLIGETGSTIDANEVDAGNNVPFFVEFGDDFEAGDTVGLEYAKRLTGDEVTLVLQQVFLGSFGPLRQLIGANGISRSGFTILGKLIEAAAELTARSESMTEVGPDDGSTSTATFGYRPHQGRVRVQITIDGGLVGSSGLSTYATVAVDTRDGSSAWVEVGRVTALFTSNGSSSREVSFVDTALRANDSIRVRIVSTTTAPGQGDAGEDAADFGTVLTRVSGVAHYSDASGSDTQLSMTPHANDRMTWKSLHGESL